MNHILSHVVSQKSYWAWHLVIRIIGWHIEIKGNCVEVTWNVREQLTDCRRHCIKRPQFIFQIFLFPFWAWLLRQWYIAGYDSLIDHFYKTHTKTGQWFLETRDVKNCGLGNEWTNGSLMNVFLARHSHRHIRVPLCQFSHFWQRNLFWFQFWHMITVIRWSPRRLYKKYTVIWQINLLKKLNEQQFTNILQKVQPTHY